MTIEHDFEAAIARSNAFGAPSPLDQLALYGLFKQAQLGDVSGKRPGMLDMRKRAKYDAWAAHKGLSTALAIEAYIQKVDQLGGSA
jgi:diazepam-binding inhibitor (GABA receptor modulating acyl-CoA-binding protein)